MAEFARIGVQLPSVPSICTMGLSRHIFPDLPNHKLQTCCDSCGIALRDAHSALADTRATAYLFRVLLGQLRPDPSPGAVVRVSWPDWPAGPRLGRTAQRQTAQPMPPPPLPYQHPMPAGRQAGAKQGARFGFGLGCGFVSAIVAGAMLIVLMGTALFFWGLSWIANAFMDTSADLKQEYAAEQARTASAPIPMPPAAASTPVPAAPVRATTPAVASYAAHATLSGLAGDKALVSVATVDGVERCEVAAGDMLPGDWRVATIERRPLRLTLRRAGAPDVVLYSNAPTGLPR